MTTRMLLLKLTAMLAAIIAGGCSLPDILPKPAPSPAPKAEPVELKITIEGEGKVNVGGEGTILAKSARPSQAERVCTCGCDKEGCTCSSGSASAAPTVGTRAVSSPQVISPRLVYECRNGVCGWYPAAPSVPLGTGTAASSRIVVYTNGSAACVAMRNALRDAKGIEFRTGNPPATNGVYWWPTAVRSDGATWTPGSSGWHGDSLRQFSAWAVQ